MMKQSCDFIGRSPIKHKLKSHHSNSDPGHTRLGQQLEKNLKITFASPSKNTVEKKKDKKIMAIAKLFVLHANAINWF